MAGRCSTGRSTRLPADSAWTWISALIFYDFTYYWSHRFGHTMNLFWAHHVVHHQSERYNLSTALRQGSFGFFGFIFGLPLAICGYPIEVVAVVGVIDLYYQYWIHTEHIGKLGWFDRVFASPSNHRVHHAVNDAYLDKNYGGIFILWDRLFGSFAEEDENNPPVYGTRAPLRSWNPLWALTEVYWSLAKDAWHARRWRDKLYLWFAPPGWRPADVAARFPKAAFDPRREEYNPPVRRRLGVYSGVQFALLILASLYFIFVAKGLAPATRWLGLGWLLAGYVLVGWLLEGRRVAVRLEWVRWALTAAAPWWLAAPSPAVIAAALGVSVSSAAWLWWASMGATRSPNCAQALSGNAALSR